MVMAYSMGNMQEAKKKFRHFYIKEFGGRSYDNSLANTLLTCMQMQLRLEEIVDEASGFLTTTLDKIASDPYLLNSNIGFNGLDYDKYANTTLDRAQYRIEKALEEANNARVFVEEFLDIVDAAIEMKRAEAKNNE